MTRLILWRHGRTEWNLIGRFQGQTDVDLDKVGEAQAETAAARVAAYAPDGIFSSDLRRAARTADYLAALVTKPVHLDDRLRERHFGRWEGLTDTEVRERHAADHARYDTTDALLDPTIEPFEDVIKRVTAALQDAAERVGPDGTAIIATHGGAARAGCVGLLGWPPELWRTVGALGNCHVAELTHSQRRGWRLAAHNLA